MVFLLMVCCHGGKNIVLGSMVVMGENAAALLEAVAKMVWGSFHQVIVLVMKLMQGSFKKGCHGGGLLMLLFVLLMMVAFLQWHFAIMTVILLICCCNL